MPILQPSMRFGMPQSKKLEFHGDQDESPVLGNFRIIFSQGGYFLLWFFLLAQGRRDGIDSLPDPLFQQCEEYFFLAPIIGIKSAARVTGTGGDVFEAGGFKTVTGKDALSGGQQLLAGRFRPLRLPGAYPRDADPALALVLRGQ